MNNGLQAQEKLLFINMTLRARLDIRDFFLKNTVREIYENIGQVLSVVRMQLAVLDTARQEDTDGSANSPGHLVGQSIRDLRTLCKSFYPDADILKEQGFSEALKNTIEVLFEETNAIIKIKGAGKDMQPEMKLIIFVMMLETLIAIKEAEGKFNSLVISYTADKVIFTVSYKGEAIKLNKEITSDGTDNEFTAQQRAEVIKAKFNLSKNKAGINRIKLTSPLIYFL